MRKFQKAAVVVAMLGSVSFLGTGAAQAYGGGDSYKLENEQGISCHSDEKAAGILAGILNRANVQVIAMDSDVDQSHTVVCKNDHKSSHENNHKNDYDK